MSTALFLHHSIGRQVLAGGLRERLRIPGIALWDHDYNEIGLTDPDGRQLGRAFPVPDDDTDPPGLLRVLRQLADGGGWDVPAHDVLVLKSCFPNNAVADPSASGLKETYTAMREVAATLPQTVLLLSTPPLVIESTTPAQARNAEAVARWLAGTWTGRNLAYGDLFTALSYRLGPLRGTLRSAFRARRPLDSHLSARGEVVAATSVARAIEAACRSARR